MNKSLSKISFVLSLLALFVSIIALAPPHRQRQWRHAVADKITWFWVKSAKVSRIAHDEFWSEGNGKAHHYEHEFKL